MTTAQFELLRLGIPLDDKAILNCEAGLEWVAENTTFEFDLNNEEDLKALPASVRLFLVKFNEIQTISEGVASESIEGLSQSFSQSNKEDMIWGVASGLFGSKLKSRVRFVTAKRKYL